MANLPAKLDISKILIDLRSITNCIFEVLFHSEKSVKIDSTDMKHLCCNFLSVRLVSHAHTCGPAHTLKLGGEAASFDKTFPFGLNTTSSC